jgi:hypothetical protein
MSGVLTDNSARSSGLVKTASGGAGVSWVESIQTSNFTAEGGKGYFVNTSGGAITVTLPASPDAGTLLSIKDYAGTFGSNNLTIARNGSKIQGSTANAKLSTNRASVTLLFVDSDEGFVFLNESNVADLEAASFVAATGGTITTSGDFKIHTFTGDGTFEVTSAGNSKGSNSVDYLVVAAGGGGGANGGGGGGAGGYRTNYPQPATAGLPVSAQEYPISVGAGGVDGGNNPGDPIGTNGGNSVFSSITSAGGGYGGSPVHTFCGSRSGNGNTGGSGGGGGTGPGSPVPNSGGAGNTPPVSPSQGNNGGNGSGGPNCGSTGGGGGGASAVGVNGVTPGSAPSSNMQGCGGAGSPNQINGSNVTYAGGGGGQRAYTPGSGISVPVGGSGGAGGGGNGGGQGGQTPNNTEATSATANTGGGGGGGRGNGAGGNGGSGVVIIRYKFQA